MGAGRAIGACAATVTVAGCAVLVVAMSRTGDNQHTVANRQPVANLAGRQSSSIPAQLAAPPSGSAALRTSAHPTRTTASTPSKVTSSARPSATASATPAARVRTHSAAPANPAPTTRPATVATHAAAPRKGQALPLHFATHKATRVITVVARSTHSTTAILQAWHKAPGGGWLKSGRSVTAHIGADGMSSSPSEFKSATPIGSFSLTRAFGYYRNPGTDLPYLKTSPCDWWISQPGPLYNTLQHCTHNSFTRGAPNEHLYYETPYYNYAVVINTPSGRSAYPHGSAFFLHVHPAGTGATAGCVAIPQGKLVSLLGWLHPAQHPRILIGV